VRPDTYSNVKKVLPVCCIVEPTRSGSGSGEREPDVVQRICKGGLSVT
jgi:hypothetical protein